MHRCLSPADMICPYCPTASPSPHHTKNGLSPPLYMHHASTRQKTDYLSALYMQHGSKPQESLSPAALYSHDDTWGKGKGGAVRRKNTAKRGTTVTRRWKSGRKSNRELRRRGAGSGISWWGAVVPRGYGAVSATAEDTHDKFPRPHHNEGKDYADGEDKGWRDAQRGVDKGVLNHGVVHYEVVVCLVSLMA